MFLFAPPLLEQSGREPERSPACANRWMRARAIHHASQRGEEPRPPRKPRSPRNPSPTERAPPAPPPAPLPGAAREELVTPWHLLGLFYRCVQGSKRSLGGLCPAGRRAEISWGTVKRNPGVWRAALCGAAPAGPGVHACRESPGVS